MRIAQLAPLEERVPPEKYGGTELIVNLLTEGLVANGHEVSLFASADSVTNARLISVVAQALRASGDRQVRRWSAYDVRQLLKVKEMQSEFDIVHNHMGYIALPFLNEFSCAVVSTIHNPIDEYCADIFRAFRDLSYVAISNSFRKLNLPHELNYVATIHNGIDISQYSSFSKVDGSKKHLLFLGRISQDKGTLPAIKIAKTLNLPLKIVGKIDSADRHYWQDEIKPLVDNEHVEYVGEVSFQTKMELLRDAIAVLYPISFPEPFGLVMAEASAMGIPVIALNRGAVPEIIIDKKNGIVSDNIDTLIKRFPEIDRITADACHKQAERYSSSHMVSKYESLYKKLIAAKLEHSIG